MLTFKNHQTLNEISLLGLYQSIVGKVKTAFASLGFGNKVSIKIPMPVQEKVDLKSRLGYFSEYATGAALAKIIQLLPNDIDLGQYLRNLYQNKSHSK